MQKGYCIRKYYRIEPLSALKEVKVVDRLVYLNILHLYINEAGGQ